MTGATRHPVLALCRADGYEISSDPARLDVDRVYDWLSTDAYWALGRTRESVKRSIENSLAAGVYRSSDGRQVAVARMVTDYATFAWLCDVYVDRSVRGAGLGRWLAGALCDHIRSFGVYRLLLATNDAHGLYDKLGFRPMSNADRWMELETSR